MLHLLHRSAQQIRALQLCQLLVLLPAPGMGSTPAFRAECGGFPARLLEVDSAIIITLRWRLDANHRRPLLVSVAEAVEAVAGHGADLTMLAVVGTPVRDPRRAPTSGMPGPTCLFRVQRQPPPLFRLPHRQWWEWGEMDRPQRQWRRPQPREQRPQTNKNIYQKLFYNFQLFYVFQARNFLM